MDHLGRGGLCGTLGLDGYGNGGVISVLAYDTGGKTLIMYLYGLYNTSRF